MNALTQRPDVQAVLRILKMRGAQDAQQKVETKMEDPEGQTWVGAILWNVGTLVQDYTATFYIAGLFISFFTLLEIAKVMSPLVTPLFRWF